MTKLALISTMLLFIYHQLILHFELFPWASPENIPIKVRVVDSILSGGISLYTMFSLRVGNSPSVFVAATALAMLLLKETFFNRYQSRQSASTRILGILISLALIFTLLSKLN